MNITDESEDKFSKSAGYQYCYELFNNGPEPFKVLVTWCNGPCSKCIGRKYNIKNGCPVCGSPHICMEEDSTLYTCNSCGSRIMTCGWGDVSAVGVPLIKYDEDIV